MHIDTFKLNANGLYVPFVRDEDGQLTGYVYIDLNSAAEPDSKLFIEDLLVDGLKAKREENRPFDSVESRGKRTAFDGDWKKQQLSEQEYMKIFSATDERYSQMLTALLAQLKKGS